MILYHKYDTVGISNPELGSIFVIKLGHNLNF